MSNSVRSQRQQPTRLPHPWDSPDKNTGVGCHFVLQCMKVKAKSLSRVRLLATPWTAAHQAPPSMGFSRREYWSGVPLPSPVGCILQYFFNELFSSYSSLFFCASNPSSPNLFSYHYVFSCNNLPTDVPITTILTEFTSLLTLSAKAYFSS